MTVNSNISRCVSNGDLTENFKILATDDEKIKSFGEIFTNESSRKILQLLFDEELSATQIAQKSNTSLQLVKYHLEKLRSLDVVKISKIEKNSKSQDMKIYTASKFSIVIVPPTLSEKTRESKSLARSFRHIYKVAGLAIVTGFSGLLSLSRIPKETQVTTDNKFTRELAITGESDNLETSSKQISDQSASSLTATESELSIDSLDFENLRHDSLEIVDSVLVSNDMIHSAYELFATLTIITIVLGGFTVYYLYKFFKKI